MGTRSRFITILLIIFISATIIEVTKIGRLDYLFDLEQVYEEEQLEHLDTIIPIDYKKILVIYENDDQGSIEIYDNLENTFNMTKLNYEMVSLYDNKLIEKINDLNEEDVIIFATEKIYKLISVTAVTNFVENGGSIIFAVRFIDDRFDEMTGVVENRGFVEKNINGFRFEKPLFPGLDKIEITSKKIPHSYLDLSLDDDIEVLATAEEIPIIWKTKYGMGDVLYTNSTLFMDKANRGLLLQYISCVDDYFISTIFNGKIVDLDDFPAPIKRGKDEIIFSQYDMKNREFFKYIWWSSMHNMAVKYDIKYTGLIIGTYTDSTKEPLTKLNTLELEDIKYYGRKLLEFDGEIGVHGYNHNSLVSEGQIDFEDFNYSPWESGETMESGLRILRDGIQELYGNTNVYTYVPPSNLMSKKGKEAVVKVFPEIKVFAGLYTGEEGNQVFLQEFGPDEDIPEVYGFPRFSSGYHYDDEKMWDIYNAIAHYGMVNHFIHPDDVFDDLRSRGKTWEELDEDVTKVFKEVYNNYPFLRPMTNIEAYEEYKKKEELKVYSKREGESIFIYYEGLIPPVYHYLRLPDETVYNVKGGEFLLIDKNSGLYLITGEEKVVEIILK